MLSCHVIDIAELQFFCGCHIWSILSYKWFFFIKYLAVYSSKKFETASKTGFQIILNYFSKRLFFLSSIILEIKFGIIWWFFFVWKVGTLSEGRLLLQINVSSMGPIIYSIKNISLSGTYPWRKCSVCKDLVC